MVTIADVARRAGVSKTTVSHVISGNRPVATTTRQRIEQVIAELGFRPSSLAQSLRIQRTHMVALVIPDITNPYYPVLARGLQDALVEARYYVFLCNTDSKRELEEKFIADAVQRKVDGIVLSSLHGVQLRDDITSKVPFISLGLSIKNVEVDCVVTNDQQGSMDATRYLIQRGYRRIGIITGPSGLVPSDARLAGYRAALEEANIPFDTELVAEGDFMRAGGAIGMRQLLQLSERPTAIFCANDLMAFGAMDAIREAGLTIPHDIALVGYDDIEAASLVSPRLTTVVNPAYEIGKTLGELLLERMQETYTGAERRVVIYPHLVQRESA